MNVVNLLYLNPLILLNQSVEIFLGFSQNVLILQVWTFLGTFRFFGRHFVIVLCLSLKKYTNLHYEYMFWMWNTNSIQLLEPNRNNRKPTITSKIKTELNRKNLGSPKNNMYSVKLSSWYTTLFCLIKIIQNSKTVRELPCCHLIINQLPCKWSHLKFQIFIFGCFILTHILISPSSFFLCIFSALYSFHFITIPEQTSITGVS